MRPTCDRKPRPGVVLGSRGAHETAPVPIAAWLRSSVVPLAARAQQSERMRRVGVLMSTTADDAEGQARVGAFLQGLRQAGWAAPGNVHIDTRWGAGDAERIHKYAAEFLALAPDVIRPAAARSQG